MKVSRAIEIKTRTGDEFLNTDPDEIEEADRLSIEALKFYQGCRDLKPFEITNLLSGETPE